MTAQTSSRIHPLSFFDALVYTLAYFPVISALACIDNPLPMPTTVHELRGQSYMRHRASYAGILHESRRVIAMVSRLVGEWLQTRRSHRGRDLEARGSAPG